MYNMPFIFDEDVAQIRKLSSEVPTAIGAYWDGTGVDLHLSMIRN